MLIRLLRTYLPRYRRDLVFLVLFQSAQAIATLLLPGITANIIDIGIFTGDTGYIWAHGGLMLLASFVQILCACVAIYFAARISMAFGRDVRDDIFHQVTAYSSREVGRFGAPSLINRNTNDVYQVQMFVVMLCSLAINAPVMCIGGVIMATRQDLGLSWILVVAVPTLAIAVGLVVSRMVPQFREMQVRIDDVNRVLREQLTGIRVVRAFVREPAEKKRFGHFNNELTGTGLRAGHWQALMFPVVQIVMNGSSVAVLWFGAGRVDAGSLQIGSLIAFLTYLVQILMSVMLAMFLVIMAPRATVCADRITDILDTASSIGAPTSPVPIPGEGTAVQLDGLGFSYPGAELPVLHDIDLRIAPGTTTAVIGSTGSGKSTLLSLIPRLMDATSGAVPTQRGRRA